MKNGRVTLLPVLVKCLAGYKEGGKFKLPANPAECADVLYQCREERLAIQKTAEALDKLETAIENYFIEALPKKAASGIAGKLARIQILDDPIPIVENWDDFYTYVKRTGSFELLQRRINVTAVRERREAKKPVPGTGLLPHKKVSCTKV